jgi:acyl-CoA dehydrogenase
MSTAESHAGTPIPPSRFGNLFHADPLGAALFSGWLGGHWADLRPIFEQLGAAGAAAHPLSIQADRCRPTLHHEERPDGRSDRIDYHPDYRALENLAYGTGLVSRRNDLGFLVKHAQRRNLVSIGSGYYFAQSEIGVMCQVCMTDGVGVILERYASNALARQVLSRLGHADPRLRLRGAMFLTERQGGSDIGTIATTARLADAGWLLQGDKAFCSNVDAEAILALARIPGGVPGTRGLGLFLILREDPPGNGDSIRIQRLVPKLGVGSTPTGDVTLENTRAHLIAGVNEGFKRMAEMINLTRLYNAAASLAGLRRALLEALAYGWERRAFGERLWDLPLWRAGMADLVAEHLGALVLTFAAVRALDAAEAGDPTAIKEVRLLIPLAKAITGKLAVFGVSECMEAVGGAGYLEDSILPRLLRDVQVLPIWEGTTHILTLDVLRALAKERAHEAFFDRLGRALAAAPPEAVGDRGLHGAVEGRLRHDQELLAALATSAPDDAQRSMREWLESAGRTAMLAFLLEAANLSPPPHPLPPLHPAERGTATPAASPPAPAPGERGKGIDPREVCLAAFRRLQARPYCVMPLVSSGAAGLKDTEEVLLRAGFAG